MTQTKVTTNLITSMDASKLTGTLPASMSDITKQSTDPTISTNPSGGVGSIILNTSTGKIFVCTDATAGANEWKAGVAGSVATVTAATGGTVTTDGDYKVHTFTTSANFIVSAGAAPIDYLVVAGGGGGGTTGGGGGGAGAVRNSYVSENAGGGQSTETDLTLTAGTYYVTVGAGGAGGAGSSSGPAGSVGTVSSVSTVTALGGGGGGSYNNQVGTIGGGSSGGGGGSSGTSGGVPTTPGTYGYIGGNNTADFGGGGGGGSYEIGTNVLSGTEAGNGGDGIQSLISGSNTYYAAGGGGGSNSGTSATQGKGGNPGAGNGAQNRSNNSTAATANTGSGGGGGSNVSGAGKAGGSGIVVLRYKFQ
jgi:hypothetical protein